MPSDNDQTRERPGLRTSKTWQTVDNCLVIQIAIAGGDRALPKRCYLIADSNQKTRGIRLTLEKPEGLKPQALGANLMRKHLPGSFVVDILKTRHGPEWWVRLATDRSMEPGWFLRIDASAPPELSLISQDRETLFRIGAGGNFSKRRRFDGDFPDPATGNTQAILNELLVGLTQPHEEPTTEPAADTDSTSLTLSPYQREARDRLARRVKTVQRSIEKTRSTFADQATVDRHRLEARLLQQFSYLLTDEMTELRLSPDLTGLSTEVVIPLAEGLSPGQQVNTAFVMAKKSQKAHELGAKRLDAESQNLAAMRSDLERLRTTPLDHETIENILKSHRLSADKQESTQPSESGTVAQPFREFQASDGCSILVAKGPREGDALIKQSRSNDHWFHIVGTTGSHVIIPQKSVPKGILTAKMVREAAMLAIHNSKLRTDLAGEVYVGKKLNLSKKKGMPPGLWTVGRSETIFVRYTSDELADLLKRIKI